MLKEYFEKRILDESYNSIKKLIYSGYNNIDTKKAFGIAYEDALKEYKDNYKNGEEDKLYEKFFKDGYDNRKKIKEILDASPAYRELFLDIYNYIVEELPNYLNDDIKNFIVILFNELLYTDEYKEKISKYIHDYDTAEIKKDTTEIKEGIKDIKEELSKNSNPNINIEDEINKNNEKEKFIEAWNTTLFLHRKEPKDKQIKLGDVYVVPKYKYNNNNNDNDGYDDLDDKIKDFIYEQKDYNMLIILGQPGVGKSSLISYICNNNTTENFILISFKNLKNIEEGILESILKRLNCEYNNLKNKVLILDGFDEVSTTKDGSSLINEFRNKLKSIKGIKVIITSRINYINIKYDNIIYLQSFDMEKINEFNKKYLKKSDKSINIELFKDNENVYGIPIILYMIYALDIKLEKNDDRCKLYSKIFALDGGIYDKCVTKDEAYGISIDDTGYHELTTNNKESLHNIAQRIAFALFEKEINIDIETRLEKAEYENIIKEIDEKRLNDFAIANYYDIGKTLQFVHKSIYEYFAAEYIYQNIIKYIEVKNNEDFAKELARLFKKNVISNEIKEFLYYKIENNLDILENIDNFYSFLEDTIELMIEDGMTYYLEEKEKNILKCEENIFASLMTLIHIIFNLQKEKKNNISYIFNNLKNRLNLSKQILNCRNYIKDLSFINLRRADLSCAYLIGADLTRADLTDADLTRVNLIASDLTRADLTRAYLIGANLNSVYLNGAYLIGANLTCTDLSDADLTGAYLIGADLIDADLTGANLTRAYLTDADLTRADLINANLTDANLTNVDLTDADLINANLTRADLTGTNLTDADLTDAKFNKISIGEIKKQENVVKNINDCYVYDKKSETYLKYLEYKKLETNVN